MISLSPKKRKVPKEYLAPRPMAGSALPTSHLPAWVRIDLIAVLVGVLVSLTSLLAPLDQWFWSRGLRALASTAPPQSIALVSFAASDVRLSSCGADVVRTLTRARVRSALVLSPLDQFCSGLLDPEHAESELAPPFGLLESGGLRVDADGAVHGFHASRLPPLAASMGLGQAPWVVAHDAESVPRVDYALVVNKDLDGEVLVDKHVVLAFDRSMAGTQPAAVAGAIAGALEGRSRSVTPYWLVSLISGLACVALLLTTRLDSLRRHEAVAPYVVYCVMLSLSVLGLFGIGSLFPIATATLALLSCLALLKLPPVVARVRSRRQATLILDQAALRTEAPHALADGEFWQRLAHRAAAAHPCDDVLIAELPPFSWRLKIWPNGDLNESVIVEKRRDIRRTPFADLNGVWGASITNDFLVMKDVSAVLVPLALNGEVEGYLILIGNIAARHFTKDPERAQNLAADLARVVRGRRLARAQSGEFRGENGDAGKAATDLNRMRAALEELKLLNNLVQHAPVGLFYADSFGDVRIIAKHTMAWLSRYQVHTPRLGSDGALGPGTLPLLKLVAELARHTPGVLPQLSDITESGFELTLFPPPESDNPKSLCLKVVRLSNESDVEASGFVATLTEVQSVTASLVPGVSRIPTRGDPLVVVSLAKLVASAVQSAAMRTSGHVKLQTPRDAANVIAHKTSFRKALEEFLVEAVEQGGKGSAPVLVLSEAEGLIELKIVDLRLGAPVAALRRTLLAPSEPPPGLDAFARFALAVENSHGSLSLDTQEGWGSTLTTRLLKARPRVELLETVDIPKLASISTLRGLD